MISCGLLWPFVSYNKIAGSSENTFRLSLIKCLSFVFSCGTVNLIDITTISSILLTSTRPFISKSYFFSSSPLPPLSSTLPPSRAAPCLQPAAHLQQQPICPTTSSIAAEHVSVEDVDTNWIQTVWFFTVWSRSSITETRGVWR